MSAIDAEDDIARMRAKRRSLYSYEEMIEQEKSFIAKTLRIDEGNRPSEEKIKDNAEMLDWMKRFTVESASDTAGEYLEIIYELFDNLTDPVDRLILYEAINKIVGSAFIIGNQETSSLDDLRKKFKGADVAKHKRYHDRRAKLRPFVKKILADNPELISAGITARAIRNIYNILLKDYLFRQKIKTLGPKQNEEPTDRYIKKSLRVIVETIQSGAGDGDEEEECKEA